MSFTNVFFFFPPHYAAKDDFEWVRKWLLWVKLRLRVSQTEKPAVYKIGGLKRWEGIFGDFDRFNSLRLITSSANYWGVISVLVSKINMKVFWSCDRHSWLEPESKLNLGCWKHFLPLWHMCTHFDKKHFEYEIGCTHTHTLLMAELSFFFFLAQWLQHLLATSVRTARIPIRNKSRAQPFTD